MNAVLSLPARQGNGAADLERKQELLFDLSFSLGYAWSRISTVEAGQLTDHMGGSRGLFDRIKDWADEFDRDWEARAEADREDYLSDIDSFFRAKFEALRAEAPRAKVIDKINAAVWLEGLDTEIAAIEADSAVGAAVVELLNRTEKVLSISDMDENSVLESDTRRALMDVALHQTQVWYFG